MEKYSDKFLNQSFKLKNSKIGMEFEFYLKELSFYKTLELLNQELSPVKIWGFRQYHPDFKPDRENFIITPDLSGGSNMVELITGPLEYHEAKYYLVKINKFIQTHGYTNEKSSIHFNLSFDDDTKNLNNLNILKLILSIDEEEIYRYYPSRKDNVYAKSVKKIIPYKEYDFFNIPINTVKNNVRIPNDKYYGINFININKDKISQRLEFRYIGGRDYEKNIGQLIYFMDKFIVNVYDSIGTNFTKDDIDKLEEYLDNNIKQYKSFSKYDNFIVEFPNIQLQIDQISEYNIISAYYQKIYQTLFKLIDSTVDLKECIINYVTKTQKLEIVDAYIKTTSTITELEMINCKLEGIFEKCEFIGCEISNSQLSTSKIINSEVDNSKVLSCKVDSSRLNNCYFMDGYLNGDMFGGVFRSGELGPYASIDSEVKIVNDTDNFFNTKFEETPQKGTDKGIISGYDKKGFK